MSNVRAASSVSWGKLHYFIFQCLTLGIVPTLMISKVSERHALCTWASRDTLHVPPPSDAGGCP